MNREKYLAERKKLMDQAQSLLDEGKVSESVEIQNQVKALDEQYEAEAKARADMQALEGAAVNAAVAPVMTGAGALAIGGTDPIEPEDIFASREYQEAFMNFVCRNVPIPARFTNANQTTTVADASAVVPKTILNEIISELKTYGNIWSKVRKLTIQGGVEVPILTLKPVANWIGEKPTSDDQKVKADQKVSFTYHGLECKIAQTLLANIVTLEMFQEQFVPLAAEAIVIALEKAIIAGDGSGKPLGITKDTRVPSVNVIKVKAADISSWESWKKNIFGKMKKSYRGGEFIMAQSTFDTYIDGMVDTTKQPIGRVNYGIDGAETYRFGGKNVEIVEDDIIAGFDTASADDVIAVFVNLRDYAVNSNMEMRTVKWEDHDENVLKNKCILICDGKLLDPNGVLIIKKDASA